MEGITIFLTQGITPITCDFFRHSHHSPKKQIHGCQSLLSINDVKTFVGIIPLPQQKDGTKKVWGYTKISVVCTNTRNYIIIKSLDISLVPCIVTLITWNIKPIIITSQYITDVFDMWSKIRTSHKLPS